MRRKQPVDELIYYVVSTRNPMQRIGWYPTKEAAEEAARMLVRREEEMGYKGHTYKVYYRTGNLVSQFTAGERGVNRNPKRIRFPDSIARELREGRISRSEAQRRRNIHRSQSELAQDRMRWLDREMERKRGVEKNPGAKLRYPVGDYESAKRALERGIYKLANNTTLAKWKDAIEVTLHNTQIISFHEDGTITLNSGGYRTATTKARMNEILGPRIQVVQKKGEWFVRDSRDGSSVRFADGMRIRLD